MASKKEFFISVDVETSGPIPGDYSMLSLGACVVGGKEDGFYVEIKPLNDNAVPDALKVTGFDLAKLAKTGERPEDAVAKFRDWVQQVKGDAKPVFVGFNAGFDWSFVNWYFIHYLSENPFGFAPLDIKSYYMGLVGCEWEGTKSSRIRPEFQPAKPGDHNALTDARAQAEMFEKMRMAERPGSR
jgi:DNA polymerase III epsilon subunit-like protein